LTLERTSTVRRVRVRIGRLGAGRELALELPAIAADRTAPVMNMWAEASRSAA